MIIKPLASSSAGNCYIVESDGEQIIIDCGIPVDRIRQEIGGFDRVVGCLISHQHGDHAGYIQKMERQTAFPIYATAKCYEKYVIYFIKPLKHNIEIQFRKFRVIPFGLQHDVDCFGFLILTKNEKLFYATDTNSVPYTFPGLTHLMIETNFDYKLIAESEMQDFVVQRTIRSHLDIDSAIEFIKRHPDLEEIWLLHLSDRHSNAEEFRRRVIDETGVIVEVAKK
jgi:phosphoribosyl 1,2-cyclic phosphodiesterase